MQVDDHDVYKYDEYASGYEKEVVNVDTKIPSSNKGFGMLMKLGWVEDRDWEFLAMVSFGRSGFGGRRLHP
jgi:hypothetical protein